TSSARSAATTPGNDPALSAAISSSAPEPSALGLRGAGGTGTSTWPAFAAARKLSRSSVVNLGGATVAVVRSFAKAEGRRASGARKSRGAVRQGLLREKSKADRRAEMTDDWPSAPGAATVVADVAAGLVSEDAAIWPASDRRNLAMNSVGRSSPRR